MKVCLARLPFREGQSIWGPMNAEDEKALKGCDEIIFDLVKKRSAGNHRRYFAFIAQAFDMQEHFDNPDIFRKYLELKAGHYDMVVSPANGDTAYWPRSISWEKLDEDEFKRLFSEVVNAFMKVYGHSLDERQINQMMSY